MKECLLCNLDESNPTFIEKGNYWTLLLNYSQPTIGSTLLVLNRHEEDLTKLTEEEHMDYFNQVKKVNWVLKNTFNPNMFNYIMMANVVRHLHYHIIPRYNLPIIFEGKKYEDENYGHTPKVSGENLDKNKLFSIIEIFQQELPKYKEFMKILHTDLDDISNSDKKYSIDVKFRN